MPADTVFHLAARGDYDAVVAMYHDQGLAPLKLIAFDEGVNLTLGLPIVRMSPDHGTAFDIAGKNKADPSSMYRGDEVGGEAGGETKSVAEDMMYRSVGVSEYGSRTRECGHPYTDTPNLRYPQMSHI